MSTIEIGNLVATSTTDARNMFAGFKQMREDVQRTRTSVSADAEKLVAIIDRNARKAQAAIEKVRPAILNVSHANESAAKSAKVFEREIGREEKAVERLKRELDPLYAAQKRFERGVEEINTALKRGTITGTQHAELLERLRTRYDAAQRSADMVQVAARRQGHAFQNAGYQVADFSIQVAGGTNAMLAFGQQSSQMLGGFGAWGSVIGAAISVTTALTLGIQRANKAQESNLTTVEQLTENYRDLNEIIAEVTQGERGLAIAQRDRQVVEIEARGIEIRKEAAKITSDLLKAEAKLAKTREGFEVGRFEDLREGDALSQLIYKRAAKRLKDEEKGVEDLRKQLTGLREEREAAGRVLDLFSRNLDQTAPLDRQIVMLEELNAAAQISAREFAIVSKTQEILNSGFEGGAVQARAYAERIVDLSENLGDLKGQTTEVEREAARAAKALDRLMSPVRGEVGVYYDSDKAFQASRDFRRLGEEFQTPSERAAAQYEERLNIIRRYTEKENADLAAARALQIEVERDYQRQRVALQLAAAQTITNSIAASSSQALDAVRSVAGESSAAYKIMWGINQTVAAAQAVVNGHVAYTNALANIPPPFNIPVANFALAAGYASAAAIAAQTIAGFEKGGLVRGGRQLIQVNEAGEEMVMNAAATRRHRSLFEAANAGIDISGQGGGKAMGGGSGRLTVSPHPLFLATLAGDIDARIMPLERQMLGLGKSLRELANQVASQNR